MAAKDGKVVATKEEPEMVGYSKRQHAGPADHKQVLTNPRSHMRKLANDLAMAQPLSSASNRGKNN